MLFQYHSRRLVATAIVSIMAVGLLFAAPSAEAGIIYQQSPAANAGAQGSYGPARAFDDFKLTTAAKVTGVNWWGNNWGAADSFVIGFYLNNGSTIYPASTPFYETTVTATKDSGYFEADLPTPVDLPGNTDLWISIYDQSGQFDWLIASGASQPGSLGEGLSVQRWASGDRLGGFDNAFVLEGDPIGVPEPSTALLLAGGVFGLAGLARRRRARTM